MHVFITGPSGHAGSYVIPELIAAGHKVTGLARSDESAAAVSALGAKVRRGDLADLDVVKAAAAESDGVIHLGYRADLLRSGGLTALRDSELAIVLALGDALAGTNKPLVVAGSIGAPSNVGRAGRIGAPISLGRPATEDDPALPSGPLDEGTLVSRNVVETTVLGFSEKGAPDLSGLVTPHGSSGAQETAKALPAGAHVVKAFNTIFGHVLAKGGRLDAFIAADDAEAKAQVSTFLKGLGLRPLDVGGLQMAQSLEWLGLMMIGLAQNGAGTWDIAMNADVG